MENSFFCSVVECCLCCCFSCLMCMSLWFNLCCKVVICCFYFCLRYCNWCFCCIFFFVRWVNRVCFFFFGSFFVCKCCCFWKWCCLLCNICCWFSLCLVCNWDCLRVLVSFVSFGLVFCFCICWLMVVIWLLFILKKDVLVKWLNIGGINFGSWFCLVSWLENVVK